MEKPEKVRGYDIPRERIILISSTPLAGFETVGDLQQVSLKISDFFRDNKNSVVLLDGLEYLITRSGFDTVYKFLQEKRFNFMESGATLLMPIDLAVFTDRERALLASEIKVLG